MVKPSLGGVFTLSGRQNPSLGGVIYLSGRQNPSLGGVLPLLGGQYTPSTTGARYPRDRTLFQTLPGPYSLGTPLLPRSALAVPVLPSTEPSGLWQAVGLTYFSPGGKLVENSHFSLQSFVRDAVKRGVSLFQCFYLVFDKRLVFTRAFSA